VQLGEADHGGRDGELGLLHDGAARDADRLAGLVLRPHAAVLAVRGADHGDRLAHDGTGAHRAGRPVDRVLQHGRDGAVVLGGEQQQAVRLGDRRAQGAGGLGRRTLDVDVLVVEGDVGQALEDVHLDALGRVLRGGLGELTVVRTGAEAADQGEDANGHGEELPGRTGGG
jgi:hypothetical protein